VAFFRYIPLVTFTFFLMHSQNQFINCNTKVLYFEREKSY